MIEKLKKHITDLKKFESQDLNEIESLKIKFLGRKGIEDTLYQLEISQSYQTHLKFQSNSALILK